MAGVRWSQQQKLLAAATALQEWDERATEVGVKVTQINLTLLDLNGEPTSTVVFEWDAAAGEYAFRTVDS